MAAYVISEITAIVDPALMEEYRSLAQRAITKYGGSYIVRGGAIEKIEGESAPHAIVIVEFPTMERAREWYRSAEYAKALAICPKALHRKLLLAEGIQM
jgi:Uncharacterized conserved protein